MNEEVERLLAKLVNIQNLEVETNDSQTAVAIFSPGRTHRYLLMRKYGTGKRALVIVMCNPSVAGAIRTDATSRKVGRLAKHNGYSGTIIVNLLAAIATDPEELREHDSPAGPYNSMMLSSAVEYAKRRSDVCVAWGANAVIQPQARAFLTLLKREGVKPLCFGVAKEGAPRHPLFVNEDQMLEPYNG